MTKPAPVPTPETAAFWRAANQRRLLVHRCDGCGRVEAPTVMWCATCRAPLGWMAASGRATLSSYVIVNRPAAGWEQEAPYVIALVDLAEGPRLMTNLTGVQPSPDALVLDAEYVVDFEPRGHDDGQLVPVFRPVDS